MKKLYLKGALALSVIAAGLAAVPAQAVEIAFSGGSNTSNLNSVTGTDGIGDTWQTQNGPLVVNSSFGMADSSSTPQLFNPTNFSNGLGSFANSFQLTINRSQSGAGFKGIILDPVASGRVNHFVVKPNPNDPSTWIYWDPTYSLPDAVTGLFQQVLFTAPTATQLSQGTAFDLIINFAGVMTHDSSWGASFDDRANASTVPEPGSISLLSLSLVGLAALYRRKRV